MKVTLILIKVILMVTLILMEVTLHVKLLSYRFERSNDPNIINDIYDGTLYKELHSFFNDPYNISLNLNYDGAPKFKSSNMQAILHK